MCGLGERERMVVWKRLYFYFISQNILPAALSISSTLDKCSPSPCAWELWAAVWKTLQRRGSCSSMDDMFLYLHENALWPHPASTLPPSLKILPVTRCWTGALIKYTPPYTCCKFILQFSFLMNRAFKTKKHSEVYESQGYIFKRLNMKLKSMS